MKRKDFIRSLLGLAAAPTVLKNIEASPDPKPGGYVLPNGLIDEMHLYTPFDGAKIKEYSNSLLKIGRPVEQISVKDAFLK